MINEHPFAFSTGTNPTLIQPTLPALVQAAKAEGIRADTAIIFPLYRVVPRRHTSVLMHIYAERTKTGKWHWRTTTDIRQRVMVYYYVPTEAMVRTAIRTYAQRCVIAPVCDIDGTSGVSVRVRAPDAIATDVGMMLSRAFLNNTMECRRIDGQVSYRIVVRSTYDP